MERTPERDLETPAFNEHDDRSASAATRRRLSTATRRLASQATSSGVVIDGEAVDFAMVLSDVSSYRTSKAKRFLKSMWIFGQQQLADVDSALAQLLSSLEEHGFRARQVQADEGDGVAGPDDVLLLITGTPDRLSREDYREQLDLWIQSRGLGEFSPRTTSATDYSPARRAQLLQPSLSALLPELQRHALRGADLLSIRCTFPLHDRQFNLRLTSHLTRHVFLQAQCTCNNAHAQCACTMHMHNAQAQCTCTMHRHLHLHICMYLYPHSHSHPHPHPHLCLHLCLHLWLHLCLHLWLHLWLQAQMLHQLRNVYGEKVRA